MSSMTLGEMRRAGAGLHEQKRVSPSRKHSRELLHVDPPLDGLWVHLLKTITIAGVCATLAGRFGDAAWHWFLRLLRWS
jgi:hypothetical protein